MARLSGGGRRGEHGEDGGGTRCAPAGNGDGGTAAAAALLAAGERRGEGEGRKRNVAQGALGGVLGLQLPSYGPTWPDQAGGRRRAVQRGTETLLPVGHCADSGFSIQRSQPSLTAQVDDDHTPNP